MASEAEGFICPYCLVSFVTSGKLQSHFIEMHSGEGQVEDFEDTPEGGDEDSCIYYDNPLGHQFRSKRLHRPSTCDQCGEIIWQDSLVCQVCQLTLHQDNCEEQLEKMCTTVNDEMFMNPTEEIPRAAVPPQAPKGILPLVRRQVAKGRDRYVNEEFDLDLTYITERIIAMSFPASGVESAYRNNLKDVAKMLKTKHQDSYMIFNLSERSYDISKFNNQVLDFGWPDHLAPSLERLSSVCKSMKSWLDSDPQHVAVVHCKGGKGRTGCVIAAYMHYSSICDSAQAALDRFAMKRFYDSKFSGVTQPSQRKYVHYFADLLAGKIELHSPAIMLNHVIIHGVPNFDGKGGCRPFLKIYENMKLVYTSGLYVCPAEKERVKISIYDGLRLQGEVLLKCFHKKAKSGMDSMFRTQFHTAVIDDTHRMVFQKQDLDDSFKDKRFPESTKVEFIFESWTPEGREGGGTTPVAADVRTSLLVGKSPTNNDLMLRVEDGDLAKRDSYASFQGGFDSGKPEGDRLTDLIQFSSPLASQGRNRSESTDSCHMDPEMIERIPHPQSEQLYTVISRPVKEESQPCKPKVPRSAEATREDVKSPFRPIPPTKPPPPAKVLSKLPPNKPARPPPPSKSPPLASNPPPQSKPVPPPKIPVSEGLDDVDYAEIDEDEPVTPEATTAEPFKMVRPETPKQAKPEPMKLVRPETPKQAKPEPMKLVRPETPKQAKPEPMKLVRPETPKQAKPEPTKEATKLDKPEVRSKPVKPTRPPLEVVEQRSKVKKTKPSYDEINIDQFIVLEALPSRESAQDNDMWMKFKFKTLPSPRPDSISHRSSSSSNLTSGGSSEYYSNLADLQIGSAFIGETQRRHSFSSSDDMLVIKGTANRDSIIPISSPGGTLEPEYKNVVIGGASVSDEALYTDPDAATSDAVRSKQPERAKYVNTPIVNGREAEDDLTDQDYENQDPEGRFHIYTNESDLMAQFRQQHLPIPQPDDTGTSTSDMAGSPHTQQSIGKSFLKLFSSFGKPKHSEIHSGKITEGERQETLAPFALAGIQVNQVNRDYEAFFKTSAWGNDGMRKKEDKPAEGGRSKPLPPRPKEPPSRSREAPSSSNGGVAEDKTGATRSPQAQRKQRKLPLRPPVATPSQQLSSQDSSSRLPSPPQHPRRPHPPLQKKPSAPNPAHVSSPHGKLQAASSFDPAALSKLQRSKLKAPDIPAPAPPVEFVPAPRKKIAPPKPPPYFQQVLDQKKIPTDATVRSLMPYWYRPNINREEAIEYVRQLEAGSFIVRDSQTVSGGYALTIKVSEQQVRQRRKLAEGAAVTEDMCVTHFLIQPDPEGVKLQGWNETAFKSLPEFIAHHTVEKLCLPCKLVLPKSGLIRRKPATMQEALVTGAACDLVYLGSVDVSGPGNESLLGQTIQQYKSLELPTMNIVTFKASKDGITLTDNINGMYIKRQYPISSVTYCGLDPNDTRWDFPNLCHLGETLILTHKPCFGIFLRLPQDDSGYSCLLFSEYQSTQPVSSVVKYVQRIMKQRDR